MAKVVLAWLLAGGIVATAAAQAKDRPAAEKRQRSAVVLRYGDAKALAETITKHFKGDGDVQVLAEPATNSLLISASAKVHPEVVKLVGELDRRPRTIAIDVLIADVSTKKGEERKLDRAAFSGPSAEVFKRVEELRKKGGITGYRRYRLTALENEPVSLTTAETKPTVVGVAGGFGGGRGGGGPATSRSISYRELGTTLDVTVRLSGDKEAQVTLKVADSRPGGQHDGGAVLGKDENGVPIRAPEFTNTTLKTRLAAPVGHAAPVQTTEGESPSGQVQTVVIVATRVIEPAAGGKGD